jgi:hypothetical protein
MVDSCAMDYFLIEAVNALRASSAVASARAKKIEQEMIEAGLIPAPVTVPPMLSNMRESTSGSVSGGGRDSAGSASSKTGFGSAKGGGGGDEEEAVRARLESIGLHVGANFAERYVIIYTVSWIIICTCTSGYAETNHYSRRHWTRSSLSAKISGRRAGRSK